MENFRDLINLPMVVSMGGGKVFGIVLHCDTIIGSE
jgi:hypothetical protein